MDAGSGQDAQTASGSLSRRRAPRGHSPLETRRKKPDPMALDSRMVPVPRGTPLASGHGRPIAALHQIATALLHPTPRICGAIGRPENPLHLGRSHPAGSHSELHLSRPRSRARPTPTGRRVLTGGSPVLHGPLREGRGSVLQRVPGSGRNHDLHRDRLHHRTGRRGSRGVHRRPARRQRTRSTRDRPAAHPRDVRHATEGLRLVLGATIGRLDWSG